MSLRQRATLWELQHSVFGKARMLSLNHAAGSSLNSENIAEDGSDIHRFSNSHVYCWKSVIIRGIPK